MHQAVAGAQQRIRRAGLLGLRQRGAQARGVQPLRRQKILAIWRAEILNGQRQVVRQGRVEQHFFRRKQNAHGDAISAAHEALAEIGAHRCVVDRQRRMVVFALDVALGGAAGHEHPVSVGQWLATQGQRLEGADGHSRNALPAVDGARRLALLPAKALECWVVLELVRKQRQRLLVEGLVARAVLGHEGQQAVHDGGGARLRAQVCGGVDCIHGRHSFGGLRVQGAPKVVAGAWPLS